ncbi:hypothetical protein WUBG_04129, partial [Wuchereria bancrofti]
NKRKIWITKRWKKKKREKRVILFYITELIFNLKKIIKNKRKKERVSERKGERLKNK